MSADFFKKNLTIMNTIRGSNSLDPGQAWSVSQTVCLHYKQTTPSGKEFSFNPGTEEWSECINCSD